MRNVLNMASGVKFDEDYLAFNSDINRMGRVLAMGGSMDAFAAGLEAREREQGTARQYTSIDTHILAMVLRAVTGKDLPQLMRRRCGRSLASNRTPSISPTAMASPSRWAASTSPAATTPASAR